MDFLINNLQNDEMFEDIKICLDTLCFFQKLINIFRTNIKIFTAFSIYLVCCKRHTGTEKNTYEINLKNEIAYL